MYSLIILAVGSFVLCASLTALVRQLCLRFNLVDRPDQTRKLHGRPVPRLGGVAIALTYLIVFALLLALGTKGSVLIEHNLPAIWRVLPSALLIFLLGVFDDLFDIKPRWKLGGQALAATCAFAAGIQMSSVGPFDVPGWLSFPLTIVWLVTCSNAINLIDGMDGLAAGLGLFAASTTLVAAILQGNYSLAFAITPLAACLVAFLLFNFNPASIFLGDSGSLLIGFLLGCYGIVWMQKTATLVGLAAPMMALAVPFADLALAVTRRFLRGRPLFSADRGHIHHILLDRGLRPRTVAFLLYGVAGFGAMLGLVAGHSTKWAGIVLVLFCIGVFFGVRHLGLVELETLQKLIAGGTFRRMLDRQIALRGFEKSLARASTREETWEVLRKGAYEFGFAEVRFSSDGMIQVDCFRQVISENAWVISVPFGEKEYIQLKHDRHYASLSMIGPFVDAVTRHVIMQKTAPGWKPARSAAFGD